MKFLKNIVLILIASLVANELSAQANLLNAKNPSQIGKKSDKQLIADNDGQK